MRRPNHLLLTAALCSALALLPTADASAQPVTVGETVDLSLGTPHPYRGATRERAEVTWRQTIHHTGATYIAPRFSRFELAEGDHAVVRSPDGTQFWTYTGYGKGDLGRGKGFYAAHIKGETAVIELYSSEGGRYGFEIDSYGRGYSTAEIDELWRQGLGEVLNLPRPGTPESLCTMDDTLNAACYQASEPEIFERANTVARLLINGGSLCTGWLVGCEGHLITNQHCIGNNFAAMNTDYEFAAQGATCAANCKSALGCPGVIEATGGTLIKANAPLDYALVLPDTSTGTGTDLDSTYGFLQLRASGAVLDERIYMPQHPAGWGKHIAVNSTYPDDVALGGFTYATSLSEQACSGGPGDVGYWADTQGGSSGSPVIAYSDHKVVALHHCRGNAFCASGNPGNDDRNRGVPIAAIIADLGTLLPQCATNSVDLSFVSQSEIVNTIALALCPAGQVALGGGCFANNASAGLLATVPLVSPPFGTEGWACAYSANPGLITAYAHCADANLSLGRQLIQQSSPTGPNSLVNCPAGTKVLSGGCLDGTLAGNRVTSATSFFSPGFELFYCAHQNAGAVTGYALCVDEDIDFGREQITQTSAVGATVLVNCSAGKKVLGGGCFDPGNGSYLSTALPFTAPGFELYGCIHGANPGSLTAFGLCIDQ